MRVRYENLSDTLIVKLRPGAVIVAVRTDVAGSQYHYDAEGELVGMEIVDASLNVDLIRSLERKVDEAAEGCLRRRRRGKDFSD